MAEMSPLGSGAAAEGKNFMGGDPLSFLAGASGGIATLLKAPPRQMLSPSGLPDPQMPQPQSQMHLPAPSLQSASLPAPSNNGGDQSLQQLMKMLQGGR